MLSSLSAVLLSGLGRLLSKARCADLYVLCVFDRK